MNPLALRSMSGAPTPLRAKRAASVFYCTRFPSPCLLAAIFATSFFIGLLRQSSPPSSITQERLLSSSTHSVSNARVGRITKHSSICSGFMPCAMWFNASQAFRPFPLWRVGRRRLLIPKKLDCVGRVARTCLSSFLLGGNDRWEDSEKPHARHRRMGHPQPFAGVLVHSTGSIRTKPVFSVA